MKLVSLKIKIRKALKVLRKHWRKITLGSFLLLIVAVVGFVSDVLGLKSYFSEKIFADELKAEVRQGYDNAIKQIKGSEENLSEQIQNVNGIICRNLEGGDWVIDKSIGTDNQYLFLKDGEKAGSIRLFGSFADTFVLQFVFIPSAAEGINATFSIKDEYQNELSLSFGDDVGNGDTDLNFDYYNVVLKDDEGNQEEINGQGNKKIKPTVKSDSEVTLQLATTQQAQNLAASAFIIYTPNKKPNEIAAVDLFRAEVPYFFNRNVRLHVGIRRPTDSSNPRLTIVNCKIEESRLR